MSVHNDVYTMRFNKSWILQIASDVQILRSHRLIILDNSKLSFDSKITQMNTTLNESAIIILELIINYQRSKTIWYNRFARLTSR